MAKKVMKDQIRVPVHEGVVEGTPQGATWNQVATAVRRVLAKTLSFFKHRLDAALCSIAFLLGMVVGYAERITARKSDKDQHGPYTDG